MTNDWKQIQARVRSEGYMNGPKNALLREVELVELTDTGMGSVAKLKLKSKLTVSMFDRLLLPDLKKAFEQHTGKPTFFEIEVANRQESFDLGEEFDDAEHSTPIKAHGITAIRFKERLQLDQSRTFNTLTETKENRFALCAAKEFSAFSDLGFSSLILHGPAGVGKSHLLHGAGSHAKSITPNLKVKIVTGDEFINDFQSAIIKKNMGDFRRRYRLETDFLMIDDLHSLCRAKGTQEEFFNLMNHIASSGRRLMITSDRPIHSLEGLEERIKSRLSGGLVIEMPLPSEESRREILTHKLKQCGIRLSEHVITEFVRKAGPCVRSLEGVLHTVNMLARTRGLSEETLVSLVGEMKVVETKKTPLEIMSSVAQAHKLTVEELSGRARTRPLVAARRESMRRLKEELGLSLAEIGRLHHRDHTTVMSALKMAKTS